MSTGTMTTEPVGGDRMNVLCQELLLPGPADAGNEDSNGISSENLAVGQSLLLTEASVVGTETSGVEIFVEAVTSSLTLSNPDNTTEVLVKVVELYFCEQCGQSFSDPSLLSQHECIELSREQLASISQLQALPLGLTNQELAITGEEPTVHQAPAQNLLESSQQDSEVCAEAHPCPICQAEFMLLSELKEHFKGHHKPQGAQVCPEESCHFSSEDRKRLQGHLLQIHQVSPVTCAYRGCSLLFRSQDEMELHHRSHFPFHCGHCDFVSANTKQFGWHHRNHMQEGAQQDVEVMLESAAGGESTEHSFAAMVEKGPADHLSLNSGETEALSKTENALESQSGWEVEEMESDLGTHIGTSDVTKEDQQTCATDDNGGDELLAEEVESSCKTIQVSKKVSSKKTKAAQVQLLKEDVVEDSKDLFKTHMCSECKRCFKKRTHLVEHLHLHFPDPRLQCPNCQKFFTSKSKLRIHMMRETGEKAHRCPFCHYSSVEKNALNRHMASMHEDISNFYSDVYTCPVCKESFRLSHALKEHLKTHKTEPKQLSCFQEDCSYYTEDRKEFLRHVREVHGIKAVECKYYACSLLFPSTEIMEVHRKTHYAFHCQQCDFICSNKHIFRKHKKQGHPGSEQLQCSFCSFATFNSVEFQDHVGKMHASEKIHKCTECSFATAHKRVLIRHMLLHTGEKPHKCELCDFTCRDVSYLSKHMLTHSDDKNYMCTECGYVTKWKHYLSVHMRKHTGDLRYQCNQCPYRCHRADQLSSHKLCHQGKSLICEVCGFACKRKYELQKHTQIKHSQDYQSPVFQCQYCNYQTTFKQALLNHENCKHTKQKEFRCALCQYCTFSNSSLLFHKRKVHGYIPGDKDWKEYYAKRQQEMLLGMTLHSESTPFLPGKEPWNDKAKPLVPEAQEENCPQEDFVMPLLGNGGSTELVGEKAMGGKDHCKSPVFQCQYCNYQTTLKHVLLNHENCKHTKQKEFRCALCQYCTFSNSSLLFHKRKVHGYIPGDKEWKKYYAKRQQEMLLDMTPHSESTPSVPEKEPWNDKAKPLVPEAQEENCPQKDFVMPLLGNEGSTELVGEKVMGGKDHCKSPVFQCQYCNYQAKCKQSLRNHENCKHTKQREFLCALCQFCTFSNSSLLFHKRKVHGYIPGDKEWKEYYAKRQREMLLAMTPHSESTPSLSGKEPWNDKAKPLVSEAQEENCPQENFVMPLLGNGGSTELVGEKAMGGKDHCRTVAAPPEEFSMKATPESLGEADESRSPVQSCTLYLETLCSSDPTQEQLTEEMSTILPENRGTENCKEMVSAYEMLGSRDSLVLEESSPALEDVPDFEEETVVQGEGELGKNVVSVAAESNEKDIQQALGNNEGGHLQTPPSPEQEEGCKELSAQGSCSGVIKQDSHLPNGSHDTPLALENALLPTKDSQSESVLKALRRQDKEQAETLVLEGRVQMLVVQSESQVFRCEKCSYITRKEKSMLMHCKAGCQNKKCPLVCQECGAVFKQQRGLNTHLLKKCPVLMKKTGKATYLDQSAARGKGLETAEAKNTGIEGLEEAEVSKLQEASWEIELRSVNGDSVATLLSDTQSFTTNMQDKPSQDAPETMVEEQLPQAVIDTDTCHSKQYYLEQGKFHCKSCSFICSRVTTICSHVKDGCRGLEQFCCPMCSKFFRSKRALKVHQSEEHVKGPSKTHEGTKSTFPPVEGESQENKQIGQEELCQPGELSGATSPPVAVMRKKRHFSCPSCPFTCHQERALKTHKKRGCLKLGEFHCTLCPFTSKAAAALRIHRKLHRKYYSARPQLVCRQCDFTCKQVRCLRQHVRIKHEGVKPHKCPYCEFSTTRRYRLDAHQSLHTGVGRITCPVCDQTFGTNSKLRIHRLRVHEKKPTHFCPFCDYSGYIQNDITRHVNSCHQGELNFACSHCEARFSSETALKQHALRQHEEKISYCCSNCDFICHSEATLKCHAQKQHPHLECATCKETLSSREELEEHKKLHFSHRCECCSFAAKERQQLVSHYLEAHEPSVAEERPFKCSFCDFACHHQLVFDHHMKGHGGTRVYKCSDCKYTTKNKQKITWHIRIHTGEKPYKCHLCQYACADPSRLKYHMRIHKEERKYLCPECGYKCKWVNQLKYHMTKHTGIKPYQCDECKYCTNRADALRIHKETRHREARSFICEQCGKAFKTRFLLKTHLKKHSEEKPYVCNVCYRGFRWAAGLRHHYLTHTNEHPFFCRYCNYKAKQKFQVIKHLQRHHPDQGEAEGDLSKGVGKDPSTLTVHLHDVQLEFPSSKQPDEAHLFPHI